jgi:hypothetical protein
LKAASYEVEVEVDLYVTILNLIRKLVQ